MVDGDHHSGQVAFPGGRQNPEDHSPEDAALREAQEEIGLPTNRVRLLGRLEELITITNYQVTPVVGEIEWPQALDPAPSEVQRVFSIPLEWLADAVNREIQMRSLPDNLEQHPVIFFKEYDGELLWGASARITLSFLEALGLA
jgi:8-oxo-dGTP pyrophosphatase MutT (NUDIX family)